jgi:hypothetical protein
LLRQPLFDIMLLRVCFFASMWMFLFSLLVPYVAAVPDFVKMKILLNRIFGYCSLSCAVSVGVVLLLQLGVDEEDRMAVSAAFFVVFALICVLASVVAGAGTYKVLCHRARTAFFYVFIASCCSTLLTGFHFLVCSCSP